jgi:hypothetical protein
VSDLPTTDRSATRDEVLAVRRQLRELAEVEGLTEVRVGPDGTVVVHCEAPGYGPMRRFATAATDVVGVWVNTVTDDVAAARVITEAL